MVMKTFLNHFDVDRAVYIRYSERVPQVLYNDTEKEMTPEIMKIMEKSMVLFFYLFLYAVVVI